MVCLSVALALLAQASPIATSEDDAASALADAAAAYSKLASYRDRVEFTIDTIIQSEGVEETFRTSGAFEFAWDARRGFALRGMEGFSILRGPERTVVHSAMGGIYVSHEHDQPWRESAADLLDLVGLLNPAAIQLIDPSDPCFGIDPRKAAAAPVETPQPELCIRATANMVRAGWGPRVPFEFGFDRATGLLQRAVYDVKLPHYKMHVEVKFVECAANPELEEGAFEFQPTETDVQVDRILVPTQPDGQPPLVTTGLQGHPAPAFVGSLLDGTEFRIEEHRGRVVLLNFWGRWCPPCAMQLPALEQISAAFQDQPVSVLGIQLDAKLKPAEFRRILVQHGVTFPQLIDTDNAISARFRIEGTPTTVLIAPDRRIEAVYLGPRPYEVYEAKIRSMLDDTDR